MELVAVDSEGVTTTIRNSQPIPMEVIRDHFTVDNLRSIVYYINSNNLMSTNLNILNSAEVSKHYIQLELGSITKMETVRYSFKILRYY